MKEQCMYIKRGLSFSFDCFIVGNVHCDAIYDSSCSCSRCTVKDLELFRAGIDYCGSLQFCICNSPNNGVHLLGMVVDQEYLSLIQYI